MTEPARKLMTIPEFLAWSERQDEGRYELANGEIVAMAPERAEHGRAKAQIWRALADAIARAGTPCEAFVDSLGVAVDAHTVYEPDVLVNCGETIAPEAMLAPSPTIIVEVLSPSSHTMDKSAKLAGYFRVASLAHYLIVDLGRRAVLHYRRDAGATFLLEIVTEGSIRLDPPGLDLALKDFFA
ncbi:Uma2 family endonuclease [Methylosinus sp. Ce-a6]|uniref:Uma2 family endonuclease n=1 Tax=Methylosinus sp. Ce-a6 TaxID=2172005 RepID=UPI00135A54BA|nr:Uma2 family endonuclease [Methylosinus sp. Ce-a6]